VLYFRVVKLSLNTGSSRYDVALGSGLLATAGSLISTQLKQRRCAIVTDKNTEPLFAKQLHQSLTTSGIEPILLTIPAGEQSKTLAQAGSLCDQMLAAKLDRESLVIGMGGGVVGDLSGFVAAIFQRGIPHVQIPTTLLAMVDSSIGGKTGVNTSAGKNLIGAVHHPALVIDDIDVLRSLPEREFRQGFAEIIKHGIIADAQMFEELKGTSASKLSADPEKNKALIELIRHNIEIKASIVKKDELDRTGDRALLNFGHTVGHGIERAGDYKKFLHGEAISLGMIAAAEVSIKRVGLSRIHRDAIVDVLHRFGLPTQLPKDFPRDEILGALKFDKKFQRGQIRFVVTPKIGSARLSGEVTLDDIRDAVDKL
jgi:3-dehydroquinate synthase